MSKKRQNLFNQFNELDYQIIEDHGWTVWRESGTAVRSADGTVETLDLHDFASFASDAVDFYENHPADTDSVLDMLEELRIHRTREVENADFLAEIKRLREAAETYFDRLPTENIAESHSRGRFVPMAVVMADNGQGEQAVHVIGIAGEIVNGLLLSIHPDETTGYWELPDTNGRSPAAGIAAAVVSDVWFMMPDTGQIVALIGDPEAAIQMLTLFPTVRIWEYVGLKKYIEAGELS